MSKCQATPSTPLICQRCIKRMDHHCMFVNNCVGQNNQKYFILFTSYTCIISMYTLIILYYHLTNCVATNWTACPAWSPPMTFVFVILLGLESFGFFIFTAVMTTIQFYCIYTDTTGIEFFKGKRRSSRSSMSFLCALKTVFGSRVGLQWLSPFSRPMNYITQNDEHITFDV
ncbi:unnamed protein product [Adineta ricciae]|uniref:Palmitoyltransferase n=1 Tax=Adineta ricciae TaxID=249248 RepID=A0A813T0L8_ADIRI|nr:unnamed protein product [Adineta ricciae]